MPDLHGWITQQIDKAEASTHDATPGPWTVDTDDDTVMADAGTVARMWDYVRSGSDVQVKADMGLITTHADPDAVLRRCAADRRVLARHRLNPDAYWAEAAMCDGCGTEGEMAYPRTENLNDCPELLDLAYAHGLTDEILAGLDRPQEGERPASSGPQMLPDGLAEALYGNLIKAVFATHTMQPAPYGKLFVTKLHGAPAPDWLREDLGLPPAEPEPTPQERALAVLEPHLGAVALYQPEHRPDPDGMLPAPIPAAELMQMSEAPSALLDPNGEATP